MRTFLKPIAIRTARLVVPNLIRRLEQLNDWAQLEVYQAQNEALILYASHHNRVIFFGDSITEFWDLATPFPGKPYINRGIAGQTTAQMLIRFRPDVLALQPKVVLILAGTNDIAGNTEPMTIDTITGHYMSMAELARANSIQVVFASVLPIHDDGAVKQSEFRSPAKIRALNDWLKQYCTQFQHTYLDYYSVLANDQDMLKAELSDDGVHPNLQGYAVMASLVEEAIARSQ
jgi:acyl-CoA thioesterase I